MSFTPEADPMALQIRKFLVARCVNGRGHEALVDNHWRLNYVMVSSLSAA
jgi:hypothetical protein